MGEEKLSFEAAMARMEEIVKLLEKGDAPLDSAIGLFEEGTALAKQCNAMLDEAEQKVVRLMKGPDGAPVEMEFDQDGQSLS